MPVISMQCAVEGPPQRLLRGVPGFEALTDDELAQAGQYWRRVRVASGETLFREGEQGDGAYVVHVGRVQLRIGTNPPGGRVLGVFSAGAVLGEMSLLSGEPRSATAVALDAVELWQVARPDFEAAYERGDAWARAFLLATARTLVQRLAGMNGRLLRLLDLDLGSVMSSG